MGLVAAVGAIGSVVAAGVSAANSAGLFSGGGGGIPQVKLQGVNLPPVGTGLLGYTDQSQYFPQVAGFTQQVNQTDLNNYTKLLNQLYPGATSQLGQISNLAGSYLQGQIPQAVQNQIRQATAQQAVQGGYAGTGLQSTNLTDTLGIASAFGTQTGEQMYQAGTGAAENIMANAGYISPGSLLFSPAQILARNDQEAYYNNQVQNQQQIINAGYAQSQQMQQLLQQQQQNSAIAALGSSLFGKSTGSGGLFGALSNLGQGQGTNYANPNFDLSYADTTAQGMGYSSYAAAEAAGAV